MSRTSPRRATIRHNEYVPKKGDLLEDFEQGITFQCMRADTWIDEKSGEKVKYGILVAYPDALEGAALPRTFLSGFPDGFLGDLQDLHAGAGIQCIRRERTVPQDDGTTTTEIRAYIFDAKADAYVFDPKSAQ